MALDDSHDKRKGEEPMTLPPEPFAVTICAPMRLGTMLVVDGLATASCTLHDQPMPVKPPARGIASRRPSIASANRSTLGPSRDRERRWRSGGDGSASGRRHHASR